MHLVVVDPSNEAAFTNEATAVVLLNQRETNASGTNNANATIETGGDDDAGALSPYPLCPTATQVLMARGTIRYSICYLYTNTPTLPH